VRGSRTLPGGVTSAAMGGVRDPDRFKERESVCVYSTAVARDWHVSTIPDRGKGRQGVSPGCL
jgi:hypothetical protein